MTTEQHNKYLAISFFTYAGFQVFWLLLMALWMYLFFSILPGRPGQPDFPLEFFGLFFVIMAAMQAIFTVPSIVAGYGLLKQKKWARIAGIVGGIMASMSVPIGTAVCVYAMWFLLTDKGKNFYDSIASETRPAPLWLADAETRPWEHETNRREYVKEPRPSDWR